VYGKPPSRVSRRGKKLAQVIAVRDEPDAEPLDAILVQRGGWRWRRFVTEWRGGTESQIVSKTVRAEDLLRRPGWRPLEVLLPEDWERGYLRAIGGKVEFVYGDPPSRVSERVED
jgi:hypothetical protein